MEAIERMLTGQMEMHEFVEQLNSDQDLQNYIRKLVPKEAVHNPNHCFWDRLSYHTLMKLNFDYLELLYWIGQFDGSVEDNLNISSALSRAYCYYHPQIVCTNKYRDAFDLYLTVIKDCYDGPEVRHITNEIIRNVLEIKTKNQRIKQAKLEVEKQFHVSKRTRPRWMQGPEWPMGIKSPMEFIAQERRNELIRYVFKDVDTHDVRVVEQMY